MYGAFDVVLYFVIIQLFWLLINLLLILSYLINNGEVCELNLLFVKNLITFFCNLLIRVHILKPQDVIP